jgi:hypothetical protein
VGVALVFGVGKEAALRRRVRSETTASCAVVALRMVPATFLPLYLTLTSPTRNCLLTCW